MSLELSSPVFADGCAIPRSYTADGPNVSPPLAISGVPEGTKSLALVVEDPDAPRAAPFVHWVLYDLPPDTRELASGEPPPQGAIQGMNDFGHREYRGPKPPFGRHRYFFMLFALDTRMSDGAKAPLTRDELDARIEGHVLEEAELVGTYARAE